MVSIHLSFHFHSNATASSFREIPSFGKDTIRKFAANPSELKKLAARDFENLLQVCIILGVQSMDGSSTR